MIGEFVTKVLIGFVGAPVILYNVCT